MPATKTGDRETESVQELQNKLKRNGRRDDGERAACGNTMLRGGSTKVAPGRLI